MDHVLLLVGTVILICILMNRWVEKLAVPSLLVFIALGMCFGENGLLHIQFDDYAAVNTICSVSLIFIMFYGGFGTNLTAARPVAVQSVVLSTLGVACTAGSVAVFVHLVFHLSWAESLLIGSVISSTDAASVFNILRTKKLALKEHTDSLLELESGSNDPISYMLTSVAVAVLTRQEISVPLLLLQQIALGAAGGLLLGRLSAWILGRGTFQSDQNQTIFIFSMVITAYALPSVLGGNGYLSVYLCGIWLGRCSLPQKRYMVHFFDVITHVCQVLIFFLLGLLVTPVELPAVLLPALAITAFLTLMASCRSGSAAAPLPPLFGADRCGILGGSARCSLYRVCHYGSAGRRFYPLSPVQPGVLHRSAVHFHSGYPTALDICPAVHDRPHR